MQISNLKTSFMIYKSKTKKVCSHVPRLLQNQGRKCESKILKFRVINDYINITIGKCIDFCCVYTKKTYIYTQLRIMTPIFTSTGYNLLNVRNSKLV